VDSDLGRGQRAVGNFGNLRRSHPLKVVENQGRSIVRWKAIDDSAHAGAHFVNHDLLIELEIGSGGDLRFLHIQNPCPLLRTPKVVGGDASCDRKRPSLHA